MNRVVAERDLGREVVGTLRGVPNHFEDGRVVLDDVTGLKSAVADRAVDASTPGHDIPLGDDCDLAGFTAGEFRRVWRAVVKWSMAASGAYLDAWRAGKPQDRHLPTQLVRRDVLVYRLAHLTDLPPAAVEACVTRLGFGHLCPRKPDVFLQPLLGEGEWVAWSPFLVQVRNSERNLLKLMARVPALKATADNLIGAGSGRSPGRSVSCSGDTGSSSRPGSPCRTGSGRSTFSRSTTSTRPSYW